MNTYVIIFDFRTYFDNEMDEVVKELNFIPFPGMSIYFGEEELDLPDTMENKGWFKVEDVDYLVKDGAFVVSLQEMGSYQFEEKGA
ncbi:MAG: hypothetical protein KJ607_08085 [Bacteroidetes bacterium]|nr:hypothetical protein [Bacteroidota bacterium]